MDLDFLINTFTYSALNEILLLSVVRFIQLCGVFPAGKRQTADFWQVENC